MEGGTAKMISEKAACLFFFFFFWAVCALNVTSLWFTGVGQIVLLWFRSAKCCLPVAQQRVPNKLGALLRVCAAKLIYWQGHVYITVAHGVSMTEDIWMLPHHLEVWNFQLLCFITSFSTFFLQTCKKKKKKTSSAITPSTPLFFLASITGLLQQIRVTLKLSHTHTNIFTFLLRITTEDQNQSHICTLNMKLSPAKLGNRKKQPTSVQR